MIRYIAACALFVTCLGCCPTITNTSRRHRPVFSAAERINGIPVVPHRAIVKIAQSNAKPLFDEQGNRLSPQQIIDAIGVRGLRLRAFIPDIGVAVISSTNMSAEKLVELLNRFPYFEYVEPECTRSPARRPRDAFWKCQLWGLHKIEAESAWNCTVGSDKVVVAVVDAGVDVEHPDLAENAWTAPKGFEVEVEGKPFPCDEGSQGYDSIADYCRPYRSRHGTHISASIAGEEGETGVVGVTWNSQILSVRAISEITDESEELHILKGLEFIRSAKKNYPAEANIKVVNMSWGSRCHSQALHDSLEATAAQDIVLVAAAGNDGVNNDKPDNGQQPYYPASFTDIDELIAVAASDEHDRLTDFSAYGHKSVHLMAPGKNIWSADVDGQYVPIDGTSFAAAYVSGAAALVAAACPDASAREIKARLLDNVDPIPSVHNKLVTGGRLNVANAVKGCRCDHASSAGSNP